MSDSRRTPPSELGESTRFTQLVQAHQHELHVHCYRMLASIDLADDIVQETFLRAWRARTTFRGETTVRSWLYRIATNACLDTLAQRRRRELPYSRSPLAPDRPADAPRGPLPETWWIQPYPDAPGLPDAGAGPDAAVIARETIELAFIAALQQLPPRQRAILVLRDVLGLPASDVGAVLDTTTAATNSGLQRARTTMRAHLGERSEWSRPATMSADEQETVQRFMAALERGDAAAITQLLLPDARGAMPPYPMWYSGRGSIVATLARGFALYGPFSVIAARANRAPAVGLYRRPHRTSGRCEGVGLCVLTLRTNRIAEITTFMDQSLLQRFGLPPSLHPESTSGPMSSDAPVVFM